MCHNRHMDRVEQWIRQTAGNASDREIARLAEIGQSTLSRQRRDGTVTVETAVKIARAYQVSVVPALLALDVLTEFDLKAFSTSNGVMDASDEDLITEVIKRMKQGSTLMDSPISEVESELERRRKAKSDPTPPVETKTETEAEDEELDYDALIKRINAGTEQVAAQKRTPPLEEHFT